MSAGAWLGCFSLAGIHSSSHKRHFCNLLKGNRGLGEWSDLQGARSGLVVGVQEGGGGGEELLGWGESSHGMKQGS